MSLENDFSKFLLLNCKKVMRNGINIQTIIRLLIDKGIFTEEEFRQKQRYIGPQKMYIDQIDYIEQMKNNLDEANKFDDEFDKLLSGKENVDKEYLKKKNKCISRGVKKEKGEIMPNIELYQGDCLDIMPQIEDKSIDMILCDLPYGTTDCKWDTVIPFDDLWKEYRRIIKEDGAIVLFGNEPFSSKLRLSNIEMYKYDWKWDKIQGANFLNIRYQPLKNIEDIMVFSYGRITNGKRKPIKYYPIGVDFTNIKKLINQTMLEVSRPHLSKKIKSIFLMVKTIPNAYYNLKKKIMVCIQRKNL